jgi:DNA-binding transcriptional ArsR family regulator
MVKYSDRLSRTFAALGDPTRRRIVERLARGSASVSDLAAAHPLSMPAVLKHVRALERAGLVRTTKHGRVRECRLSPRPMRAAATWLELYRGLWDKRLDRLAEHLRLQQGEKR